MIMHSQLAELDQLASSGQLDAAIERCEELLKEAAEEIGLLLKYAQLLEQAGRGDDAGLVLLMASIQAPTDPAPLRQLGRLSEAGGDQQQALTFYRQALNLAPTNLDLLLAIGRLLSAEAKADEAAAYFEEISRLDPDQFAPAIYLGKDAHGLGFHSKGIEFLQRALKLPTMGEKDRLEAYALLIFQLSAHSAPSQADHINTDHTNAGHIHTGHTHKAPSQAAPGQETYRQYTQAYWNIVQDQWVSCRRQAVHPGAPAVVTRFGKRLRIGILGGHFGRYVVSTFLESFLLAYDHADLDVQLLPTTLHRGEGMSYLAGLVDAMHSLDGLNVDQARSLLHSHQYDILVDTSGFTDPMGLQILAERCAAVQCHWIGYHASTGLGSIDWFLGDQVFTPDCLQSQFLEGLWPLPRPWLAMSTSIPPPQAEATMATQQPVLGSFNQLAKISESTLDHWAAALAAVPLAQLLIKNKYTINPSACRRISEGLERRGIEPSRLLFRPATPDWFDHLRAYNSIDVALDCTPWSSSTTAFDALSMGVPLAGINGDCAAAKMSSSLLTGIGRVEWISTDPQGFAATVAELCRDLPSLRAGKAERQQQVLCSPLFDPRDLADHLGRAFHQMDALGAAPPRPAP